MTRLHGKRALITGGTSGIGLETARRFLAEGARIIITGSSQHTADAAAATLEGDVLAVGANALDLNAQRSLAGTVEEHFGELDVAFLNAGISDWRPFEQHDEESFDRLFDIRWATLWYSGITTTGVTRFPTVRTSTAEQRATWQARVRADARRDVTRLVKHTAVLG